MKKIAQNIPNILSGYRLLVFPLLMAFVFAGEEKLFILFLSVSLITDILDGLIARTFKLETEFGAKLDSLADIGSMIAGFSGMFVFQKAFLLEEKPVLILIFSLWTIPQLICFLRFRHFPHLHLYSNKIAGYFMGIFIFTCFNFGPSHIFFHIMFFVCLVAFTEELIVVLTLPVLRSNVKGVYWMLKEKNRIG